MIEFRPKLWTSLTAAALLAACGQGGEAGESAAQAQHGEAGESAAGETGGESGGEQGGEAGGEQGESGAAAAGLGPAEQQAFAVAQMRGHFRVAKALAEAGQAEASSPHFGHPLYEVYEANRAVFGSAQLNPAPFEKLNQQAAAKASTATLQPLFVEAEGAIAALAPQGEINQAAVLKALLKLASLEYREGVAQGAVVDPVEYQDAYGFSLVALDLAKALPGSAPAKAEVVKEAEALVALFPSAAPPAAPAAPGAVLAQVSRIELALAGL